MGYRLDLHLQEGISYRNTTVRHQPGPTLAYVADRKSRIGWRNFAALTHYYAGARKRAEQLGFMLEYFLLGEHGITSSYLKKIFRTGVIKGIIVESHMGGRDGLIDLDWSL